MSAENQALTTIVARIIEMHRDEPRINPTSIATAALLEIDPAKISLPAVLAGCHLALRQIARNLCRKQFDQDDDEAGLVPAQQELFPGLQYRYPAAYAEDEEPTYVLRDSMTEKDVRFNVQRLRKEGQSKIERAESLEAWWRIKQRAAAVAKRAAAVSPAA